MDDMGTPTAELTGVELRPIDPRTLHLPLAAEDLRHRMGGKSRRRLEPASRHRLLLPGAGCCWQTTTPRHRALAGGIRYPVQLTDPASDQRTSCRMSRQCGRPSRNRGRSGVSGRRHDRVRRTEFVRRRRPGRRASACARVDLGDLGRGARCCRRLAGTSPRLWLITRNGLAVRGDEPGDPAIGALKGAHP